MKKEATIIKILLSLQIFIILLGLLFVIKADKSRKAEKQAEKEVIENTEKDVEKLLDEDNVYLRNDINRSGNAYELAKDNSKTLESKRKDLLDKKKEAIYESKEETKDTKETKTTETTKNTTSEETTKKEKETTTTAKATTTETKPKATAPKTVTVKENDGWWNLGQRANVDYRYLAVYNNKLWTDTIHVGETYKVPTKQEIKKIKLPKITEPTKAAKKTKTNKKPSATKKGNSNQNTATNAVISLKDFMFKGVVNWQGKSFTYYSQQVLPGPNLKIPGRHVNSRGYVTDDNGYIVLASDYYPKGTVVTTRYGNLGKVYDAFGTGQPANRFDVYIR